MGKVSTLVSTALLYATTYGQTTTAALFHSKDYQALVTLEGTADALTGEELCMVGYAFFQLENDAKAVAFYDKAIAKGFDNGPTHFYKSISLTYLKKYDTAVKEIDLALQKEPTSQEYMNQKGVIYLRQGLEDKAMGYFDTATRYVNTVGEPYFWMAYIYHGKQDLENALRYYYIAAEKVPKTNRYYVNTLQAIGQLEYTFTQNYRKSADAYADAIALRPTDYDYYPKLIKAYNAVGDYAKATAVFERLQTAYKNNELSEALVTAKCVGIDEFEWNKQAIRVFNYLEAPTKPMDILYKVFLYGKAGGIDRILTVEKTIQVGGGNNYVLCEVTEGAHLTYPYGWKTDIVPLEDLKKVICLVLDDKIRKSATVYDGE